MSIIKDAIEVFIAIMTLEAFVVVLGFYEVWDVAHGRPPRHPFEYLDRI